MKRSNSVITLIIKLGISLGISVLIGAVLLLIGTAVAYNLEDPAGTVKTVSLISIVMTALIGGIVSSRFCDRDIIPPIPFSAITGTLFVLLSFLLTVLPVKAEEGILNIPKILIYIGEIAVFTLGGIIGRPREKKRLPYKKKLRR